MSDAPSARNLHLALLLPGLACLAGLVMVWQRMGGLRQAIEESRGELQAVQRTLHLLRLERGSKGLGIEALLEQLRHYAPLLDRSTTPRVEVPAIEARVREILSAMEGLGPEATRRVEQAFLAETGTDQDEYRKWLLVAATRLDPIRGKVLLARVIRALDLPVSARLRWLACDEMVRVDAQQAGLVLRELLRSESARGVQRDRLPPELRATVVEQFALRTAASGFHNFVARYADTKDPDLVATLLMVIGRQEHDLPTIQECVKVLGQVRAREASEAIRKLFQSPPAVQDNPLFRNHCLDAIAAIDGSSATEWFEAMLRAEKHELVRNKLVDLLKRTANR